MNGESVTRSHPDASNGAAVVCDVVVVGAGPAGCASAVHLARSGRDVVVIDKATFPRDKTCGDGLTTLALRELTQLGLRTSSVPSWRAVRRAVLRAPNGRQVITELPGDGLFAAVAPRRELDAALVDVARQHSRVQTGTAFESLDVSYGQTDPGYVDVVTSTGTVRARYVVAADGMWSPVRRSLGLTPSGYRGEWHAFRQYVSNVTGPAADELFVWFDADLLPGYAWSFPLPDGRVNLGFGVLRQSGADVQHTGALWRELTERPHVASALGDDVVFEGRRAAWPIPARIDQLPLADGRVLFVGDAAGATDVLTGEGIGQALLTGRLAAEAIDVGGGLDPLTTAEHYRRAVRDELFADHRMSARLGRIMATERGANTALSIVGHSGDWGRRNFARWMWEDEPRAIAFTPRRWHRRVLSRPGVELGQ